MSNTNIIPRNNSKLTVLFVALTVGLLGLTTQNLALEQALTAQTTGQVSGWLQQPLRIADDRI